MLTGFLSRVCLHFIEYFLEIKLLKPHEKTIASISWPQS
jgi:hypothetical protein